MRGSSMHPLLGEGMLLEIDRSAEQPRVGRIAVFRADGRVVAHRVLRCSGAALICCGDAQPDRIDVVPANDLLGEVRAVYERAGNGLRRIDTPGFWLRGYVLAYLQPARSLLQRFLPRRRERVYRALTDVASGIAKGDRGAVLRHIEGVTPVRLAAVAQKHRIGALLCETLAPLQQNDYARALYRLLRRGRWSAAAFAATYRQQVLEVIRILREAGVEAVLLKGAARAFRRQPTWELHQSSDIDVLVERHDVERACAALRSAGYTSRCAPDLEKFYRTLHHHAAPLYPQTAGVPVEVHHALDPSMLQSTSLAALRPHVVAACEDGIASATLDAAGTAAHFAIHNAPRAILRDLVLLAGELSVMRAGERRMLAQLLRETGGDGVAARAVLALSARMAGIPWDTDGQVERYVRWMLRREDLPRLLRARPECVDAWLGSRGSRLRAVGASLRGARALRTACARAAAGAAIAMYLPFMR